MPKSLTTTSYAVLGLLALRPWTTYELAKQVQRSLDWFWPRAERKLYDEPKRLVAARPRDRHRGAHRPAAAHDVHDHGRGPRALARVARRAAGAAHPRVRGDGEGLLRRRRVARAAARHARRGRGGDAHNVARSYRRRSMPQPKVSVRVQPSPGRERTRSALPPRSRGAHRVVGGVGRSASRSRRGTPPPTRATGTGWRRSPDVARSTSATSSLRSLIGRTSSISRPRCDGDVLRVGLAFR